MVSKRFWPKLTFKVQINMSHIGQIGRKSMFMLFYVPWVNLNDLDIWPWGHVLWNMIYNCYCYNKHDELNCICLFCFTSSDWSVWRNTWDFDRPVKDTIIQQVYFILPQISNSILKSIYASILYLNKAKIWLWEVCLK